MANMFAPDQLTEAAISKQSIIRQQTALYQLAHRCLPVLWERLVFPVLLSSLENKPKPTVAYPLPSLHIFLKDVVPSDRMQRRVIELLYRYDYLRRQDDGKYTAGSRLWTEINAGQMMKALQK